MLLQPKNWVHFQHYKDRCPPWIKLHRDLLNDRDFICLPLASKALAPMMWLLASESKDGTFEGSLDELVFRLRITEKEYNDGVKPLIDKGFFIVASGVLAECLQVAIPERETEAEKETEKKKNTQRGTRLPTDFDMPDSWGEWCEKERPDLIPRKVFDSFKDYWVSAPKGTKLDWFATWRNWVRSQKQGFVKPQDVVHQTTPTPKNHDEALKKILEDDKKATKPNADVQARIDELLNRKVV